ncbi:MAG TPA: hypothetical protein VK205_10255 [Prolixibacteraceae bacterium]|nr:hypothetical protein [Prolixibacteraceae bacterium]
METIIRIKKNKPAFKALILLAKELEKNEPTAISIIEEVKNNEKVDLIVPTNSPNDPFPLFDQLTDFSINSDKY